MASLAQRTPKQAQNQNQNQKQKQLRSTLEVLNSHILKSVARRVDEDIEFNYANDIVLFTANGIHRGKLDVRQALIGLLPAIESKCDEYEVAEFTDSYAFVERRCSKTGHKICESIFIKDGLIAVQMIHVLER